MTFCLKPFVSGCVVFPFSFDAPRFSPCALVFTVTIAQSIVYIRRPCANNNDWYRRQPV